MEIRYDESEGAAPKQSAGDAVSAVKISSEAADESRAARKAALLAKIRKKRAVKRYGGGKKGKARQAASIPEDLREGRGQYKGIDAFIGQLPSNYTFEVKKSVWRVREAGSRVVALQFPEGLLLYSCIIADILERYCSAVESVIIMGDVTYGACCIDDYTAKALGADFLIHYGHSCLVPVDVSQVNVQYVFVDIAFDVKHLVETVKFNFQPSDKVAVVGTIQFASSFHRAKKQLDSYFDDIYIPQALPLSPGELLGCTSPKLPADTKAIVYVADGRFHLESIMIANPSIAAYRYDPHSKKFTVERYELPKMMAMRSAAVRKARSARCVGVILGTLGRQGNPYLLDRLIETLEKAGKKHFTLLLSEIFPAKLAVMKDVDCWVQIACPRLSIDWGYAFEEAPLLNPYEAEAAFNDAVEWSDQEYPMDFYKKKGGRWTNYYGRK